METWFVFDDKNIKAESFAFSIITATLPTAHHGSGTQLPISVGIGYTNFCNWPFGLVFDTKTYKRTSAQTFSCIA